MMAWVAVSAAPAAEPEAPAADPWNGKARADVVQLLGEPNRVKMAKDGRETLTYTFDRIAPDAPLHPEVMLMHVPGIGVVARIDRSRPSSTLELEPPEYDKGGRPAGGGLTQTSKTSTSYDPKTGKVTESSGALEKPQTIGKVKLRLVVAPSGVVESWSAKD